MIDLYSANVAAVTGQTIQWDIKTLQRGIGATLDRDKTTIYLNEPGAYRVHVHGYGTTTAAGTFGFQLTGDGVDIVRGAAGMSTAAGAVGSVAFSTPVAVNRAAGVDKAALNLVYTGGAGTISLVEIGVEKVA